MKIPARAPRTPARQVPSRLDTFPEDVSVAVSSPRYQTLPLRSCAYQSLVRSRTRSRSMTRSSTPSPDSRMSAGDHGREREAEVCDAVSQIDVQPAGQAGWSRHEDDLVVVIGHQRLLDRVHRIVAH